MTDKKPRRRAVGRKIASFTKMSAVRAEIVETLAKKVAGGMRSPWHAEGALLRHIALDIFTPVSLCGRFVGDVSSIPMPTPLGAGCPTCVRIWNSAVAVNDAAVHIENEKLVNDLANGFDALLGAGDIDAAKDLWRVNRENGKLLKRVIERLDERGVEIELALEVGEHHPFQVLMREKNAAV